MRATLVVAREPFLYVLPATGEPLEAALRPETAGGRRPGSTVPPSVLAALERRPPAEPVVACGEALASELERALGRRVGRADAADWHAALRSLGPAEPVDERRRFLERARRTLEEALRSPDEVLITLAREEERLERSVGRESRAAEAFVTVPGTVLAEVAVGWSGARDALADHHRELALRLETEAQRLVPNLSALLGARTAARLVAAAGGPVLLARLSASRLQLLGSRRRPSAERGPRYGLIYRADGMDELPLDRRGAYARSLAALAAIAARADAFTHRDLAGALVRRRDARHDQLRRRRP